MNAGQTFTNGQLKIYGRTFPWGERLTVTGIDARSYGVKRYTVVDRYGRHGYAY